MKKYFCASLFLLLLIKPPLEAAPNQEGSVLAVTIGCYCDFLNSTATSDPHDLYDAKIALEKNAIMRTGAPGNYFYFVAAENKNELVHEVSFENQKRFCNWIENGRASNSTETGAYDLASLEKSASALCALVDENEGEFFYDPALKINTTTFSITGPAELLGTGSTLSNPKLCVGEEAILPCYEELEYLLGIAFLGAGMEGARSGREDQAPGDRTATEIDVTRETSREIPAITDRENNSDAFANERSRFSLPQQLQETEKEHQLAQEQHRIASVKLEEAALHFEESKGKWKSFSDLNDLYCQQETLVNQLSQELAAASNDLMGISFFKNNAPYFTTVSGETFFVSNKCWENSKQAQEAVLENIRSKHMEENKLLLELASKCEELHQKMYASNYTFKLEKARQTYHERSITVDQTQKELTQITQKRATLQQAQEELTSVMALIQEKIEPLKSKLQENEFSLFSKKCTAGITALRAHPSKLSPQDATLEIINREIEILKNQITAREEEDKQAALLQNRKTTSRRVTFKEGDDLTMVRIFERDPSPTQSTSAAIEDQTVLKITSNNSLRSARGAASLGRIKKLEENVTPINSNSTSNNKKAASTTSSSLKDAVFTEEKKTAAIENISHEKSPAKAIEPIPAEVEKISEEYLKTTAEVQRIEFPLQIINPKIRTEKSLTKAQLKHITAEIEAQKRRDAITAKELEQKFIASMPEQKETLIKYRREYTTEEDFKQKIDALAREKYAAMEAEQQLAEAAAETARLELFAMLDKEEAEKALQQQKNPGRKNSKKNKKK